MATAQQTQIDRDRRRLDKERFINWCERQIENSQSPTARIIENSDQVVRFRIREEADRGPEDVILIKGKNVDTIRFERGKSGQQFHLHRREVKLCEKTLILKTDGQEMCRVGTGTKNKRGAFPV